MATTKAQQKAVNKYMKENYDRVNLTMPKGKKAEVQAHAEAMGESVNAFINRAIDETMERDTKEEGYGPPPLTFCTKCAIRFWVCIRFCKMWLKFRISRYIIITPFYKEVDKYEESCSRHLLGYVAFSFCVWGE